MSDETGLDAVSPATHPARRQTRVEGSLMSDAQNKLDRIETMILSYGEIDGAHHKMWVLDQVMRIVWGDEYDAKMADFNSDPGYDNWDTGIAP